MRGLPAKVVVAALVAVTLSACGGASKSPSTRGAMATQKERREAAQPPPRWSTDEGKQEVRLELAERMLDIGQVHEAQSMLRLAREDGVTGPEIDLLQGRALHLEGLHKEAEQMMLVAGQKLKKDPRIPRALGLLYAETDRVDEAITQLERSLELDDNHAATWNNLGFLLFSQKRTDQAIVVLRKAVSLDGTKPKYRLNLGFALFHAGDSAGALSAFNAAGPPADAWYNMGLARELAGDLDGARTGYRKSIELNPSHRMASDAIERLTHPADPATDQETP